jgi:flagellar biosynthesis/type III secretory pathway protein FliH
MSATLTINLGKAIGSATISGDCESSSDPVTPGTGSSINEALQDAAGKLNKFYEGAFVEHKEQIAKLAVEIARKILVQKVEEGEYEIESIIKEAISNSPTRQDIVVRLNPDDLSQYEQLREKESIADLAGVKFVADANIGRAECVLETPKGIIESLIEQHLEQVGKALKGVK